MLLQAEQMLKMTIISLKIVKVVILSENSCHFVSCSSRNKLFFSQLEISHVLNGPTAKNQRRCRGPRIRVLLKNLFQPIVLCQISKLLRCVTCVIGKNVILKEKYFLLNHLLFFD